MFRFRLIFPKINIQPLVTAETAIRINKDFTPSSLVNPHQLSSKSLAYFQTYFTLTYYICLSPFTITYNSTLSSYTIHKSKFQNLLCFGIQFSILFQYLSHCRGLDIKLLHSDPTNYFEIANVIGTLAYYLVLFSSLWTKQQQFLAIFNLVTDINKGSPKNDNNNSDHLPISNNGFLSKLSLYLKPLLLCCIFLTWTTYSVVSGLVAYHKYVVLAIPKDYSSRAEFVYLFHPRKNSSAGLLENVDDVFGEVGKHEPLLIALTIWYIFIEFYIWLGSYFCDLLVLIAGIFIQQVVMNFAKSLHLENMTPVTALQTFLCLKKITAKLNSATGPLVLCVVVAALPYYASNIETVFTTNDGMRRLRICFYCLVFFMSLAFASQGSSNIAEFKDWLFDENRSACIPQSSLILILNEINLFGLSGCGFFTVTFGFFGTILSVLLTYSFIIVQFHSTQAQNA